MGWGTAPASYRWPGQFHLRPTGLDQRGQSAVNRDNLVFLILLGLGLLAWAALVILGFTYLGIAPE